MTILATQALVAPVETIIAWPTTDDRLVVQLDDALFTDPDTHVDVEIATSFDGGKTWTAHGATPFIGGPPPKPSPDERLPSRGLTLGPFMVGTKKSPLGEVTRPTHAKVTMTPRHGTPVLGLSVNT